MDNDVKQQDRNAKLLDEEANHIQNESFKQHGNFIPPKQKHMEFDDLLMTLGEFGRYQKKLYCLLVLPSMFVALQGTNYVFILGKHQHSCDIPTTINNSAIFESLWDNNTYGHINDTDIPTNMYNNMVHEADECYVHVYDNSTNRTATAPCTGWEYSTDIFISSGTSEFNLVCDNKIYKSHASMASFAGSLLSAMMMGVLGDILGRRLVFCIGVTLLFVADIVLAFAPDVHAFAAIHFFSGYAITTTFSIAVVTILEMVGPSKRTVCGIGIELVYCCGEFFLCAAAYFVRRWRHLQLVISVPSVVLLSYWFIIDESPRWLLSKGKNESAFNIIRKISKENKVSFTVESQKLMVNKSSKFTDTFMVLIRNRELTIRVVVLMISWFATGLAYYGLTYNVGTIGGNIYINFFFSVLVECIGYSSCLFFSEKLGRKITHCGSLILAGTGCLLTIFTVMFAGPEYFWITILLSNIGKCGVSATYGNIYIFTPELFPTYLRSSILGASNVAAKLGILVSPYIANIADFVEGDLGNAIALSLFGSVTVVAGLISLILPETVNKKLPETIEEALELSK